MTDDYFFRSRPEFPASFSNCNIATAKPKTAPTETSHGPVPHRESAQWPITGGNAISSEIVEICETQCIATAIGGLRSEGSDFTTGDSKRVQERPVVLKISQCEGKTPLLTTRHRES